MLGTVMFDALALHKRVKEYGERDADALERKYIGLFILVVT